MTEIFSSIYHSYIPSDSKIYLEDFVKTRGVTKLYIITGIKEQELNNEGWEVRKNYK